jgi:hypothetical protein
MAARMAVGWVPEALWCSAVVDGEEVGGEMMAEGGRDGTPSMPSALLPPSVSVPSLYPNNKMERSARVGSTA